MSYVICTVPVSPMRLLPSHVAEMVSQLLFGETCRVLETSSGGFLKLQCIHDGYVGYCSESQFIAIDWLSDETRLSTDWISEISFKGALMKIPFGSIISNLKDVGFEGRSINIERQPKNAETLKQAIQMFINTPYLWGGRSVFGTDHIG